MPVPNDAGNVLVWFYERYNNGQDFIDDRKLCSHKNIRSFVNVPHPMARKWARERTP